MYRPYKYGANKLFCKIEPFSSACGISPSSVLAGKSIDYLNFLVDMIKELSIRNFHIVLYPNAVRESHQSHKSHNNDLLIINDLKEKLCKFKGISYVDFDIHTNVGSSSNQ